LLEGPVEFSTIKVSELDSINRRIDAEFYQRKHLRLEQKLKLLGSERLRDSGAKLDCSAFYPSITDAYNFEGEGVPFLRVNEIQNGLVKTTEGTAFLPQSVLDANASTICRVSPFDIIIAKGGNSLAKLGLVPEEYKTYALSRDLIAVKTSKLKRNRYFVWLFLHSDFGQCLLWRTASQTGQPHLTLPSIDALDIPVFSKAFEAVAENLYRTSVQCKSDAFAAYAASESMLLAALGLAGFSQSGNQVNIKSYKDSFVGTGRLDAEHYQPKYDDLHQALITHSCGTTTVGDLAGEIANGAEVREYQESGTPYLRVGDLRFLDIDASSVVKIDPVRAESGLKKIDLQVGDVLISRSGSLAISAVVEAPWDKALISSHLIRLRIVDKRINPYFLALFFMTTPGKMQIQKWSNGGVQPEISQPALKAIVVPVPPMAVQLRIRDLILNARQLRDRSNGLLEAAKRAVEIAIEKDEAAGLTYLADQGAMV